METTASQILPGRLFTIVWSGYRMCAVRYTDASFFSDGLASRYWRGGFLPADLASADMGEEAGFKMIAELERTMKAIFANTPSLDNIPGRIG